MTKKAYYFIDDVIWLFRDLTRQRPASMFDHPFLGALKKAHDDYGVKTQLNVFYRTSFFYNDDEFTLADMTDAYKAEWESCSDWLKLAFHSKEEFPDYPFVNADYDVVKNVFEQIIAEIRRFAGEKTIAWSIVPHWLPISKDGIRALHDCGIKLTVASWGDKIPYDGDPSSLPYGHANRLLHNRKPETCLFTRTTFDKAITRSICGYNHLSPEEYHKINKTCDVLLDEETGMYFNNSAHLVLNLCSVDTIHSELDRLIGQEFISVGNHEQYFHSDYFAYQPDYAEKIYAMGQRLHDAGYEFIFTEDLV